MQATRWNLFLLIRIWQSSNLGLRIQWAEPIYQGFVLGRSLRDYYDDVNDYCQHHYLQQGGGAILVSLHGLRVPRQGRGSAFPWTGPTFPASLNVSCFFTKIIIGKGGFSEATCVLLPKWSGLGNYFGSDWWGLCFWWWWWCCCADDDDKEGFNNGDDDQVELQALLEWSQGMPLETALPSLGLFTSGIDKMIMLLTPVCSWRWACLVFCLNFQSASWPRRKSAPFGCQVQTRNV